MKFKITVRETKSRWMEVEVDSVSREAAENQVLLVAQTLQSPAWTYESHITKVQQLGEPWISGGWYDLHGPDEIVYIQRAVGNVFTTNDIKLLQKRLVKLKLKVLEYWNGDGREHVSFRCTGRVGTKQFTKQQLKLLLAPRSNQSKKQP